GEVDVALLPLPADSERLRIAEVGHDELIAIVPPTHSWVGRVRVTARDFEDEPIILYDRQSPITERTLACLLDEGGFPRVAAEIDHLEALKNLVRMGVGVSVVPRWSALRELAAGALSAVSVASPRMPRLWGLCYLDGQQQSAPIRALLEVCAESLPRRLAQGAVAADDLRRAEARLTHRTLARRPPRLTGPGASDAPPGAYSRRRQYGQDRGGSPRGRDLRTNGGDRVANPGGEKRTRGHDSAVEAPENGSRYTPGSHHDAPGIHPRQSAGAGDRNTLPRAREEGSDCSRLDPARPLLSA